MNTTKEIIADAMIHLVETVEYKKISIQRICETAHISRNAFYYHFENKEAVIQWIVDQQFVKYSLPFFKIHADNTSTKSFFGYILERKTFYRNVFLIDDGHLLFDCFRHAYAIALEEKHIKEYGYTKKKERQRINPEVCKCYANAGTAAVTVQWIREDMTTPVDQIAEDLRLMLTKSLEDVRDLHMY